VTICWLLENLWKPFAGRQTDRLARLCLEGSCSAHAWLLLVFLYH